MPLLPRSDGDLARDLAPVRRILPYLMRTRAESVVYYEQLLDATAALAFVARWNEAHAERRISVFHLALAAFARVLHERPGLNRFVSGGRIWQRRGVQLSFAAKQRFSDEAPLVTVKLDAPPGEPFPSLVERVHAAVDEGRSGRERGVDREVRRVTRLPGPLLRLGVALVRWLDRVNLLPSVMTRDDPMYASLFAANLGSLGLEAASHHPYEYGTVSLFAAVGHAGPRVVVGDDGAPRVRETLPIRYTFDERIEDGFYCVRALELVRAWIEEPERLVTS